MNFSLKRCSSLIKGRKAVLGNSDFSWYARRQTQQGPLSLAISLPLSEQFWDEDKQWKGRWQKCSHQQRQSWAEAHTPPETPNHQNLEPRHKWMWPQHSMIRGGTVLFWKLTPTAEQGGVQFRPLHGKRAVNFPHIVQAASSCQIQLKVLQGDTFQCCHYQRPTSLLLNRVMMSRLQNLRKD